MPLYRETLFARALDRLVVKGGYRAAYLVGRDGLVWAYSARADYPEVIATAAMAAVQVMVRLAATPFGAVRDVIVHGPTGETISFIMFKYEGENEGEFLLVTVATAGEGRSEMVADVIAEVRNDLEAFY